MKVNVINIMIIVAYNINKPFNAKGGGKCNSKIIFDLLNGIGDFVWRA